jgi:hypothetical protein
MKVILAKAEETADKAEELWIEINTSDMPHFDFPIN